MIDQKCVVCGNRFEAKRRRAYCSDSCCSKGQRLGGVFSLCAEAGRQRSESYDAKIKEKRSKRVAAWYRLQEAKRKRAIRESELAAS
jgi:hypothetical protein